MEVSSIDNTYICIRFSFHALLTSGTVEAEKLVKSKVIYILFTGLINIFSRHDSGVGSGKQLLIIRLNGRDNVKKSINMIFKIGNDDNKINKK